MCAEKPKSHEYVLFFFMFTVRSPVPTKGGHADQEKSTRAQATSDHAMCLVYSCVVKTNHAIHIFSFLAISSNVRNDKGFSESTA